MKFKPFSCATLCAVAIAATSVSAMAEEQRSNAANTVRGTSTQTTSELSRNVLMFATTLAVATMAMSPSSLLAALPELSRLNAQ